MEKNLFILTIANYAKPIADRINVTVLSGMIAQAISESRWGESLLTKEANNLFGIKWTKSCNYDYVEMNTKEEVNGKKVTIKGKFRKYEDWKESLGDYYDLMCKSRYKRVREAKTAYEYCEMLQECGYATDSQYANKLKKLIDQYGLTGYDAFVYVDPVPDPPSDYARLVEEVFDGRWGNGEQRKELLTKCGYDYEAVRYMVNLQDKINRIESENISYKESVERIKEVIHNI